MGHWRFALGTGHSGWGRQKSDYVNKLEAFGPVPHKVLLQWAKEEGEHRVWMEHPTEFSFQMAAYEAPFSSGSFF